MKRLADLHTHSTASDGQYSPSELAALAKERGLEVLALTDHDTMDGVAEAERAGQALGLYVIRGVELSAGDHQNLHILGYGYSEELLRSFFEERRRGRERRKYRIADYLRSKGVPVDLAVVERLAGGAVIGRPHFALALVEAGYVATRREAFDRYLDTPEFQSLDQGKPRAQECVRTLKEAGAKVSLAHPYQIALGDEPLDELVRRLADCGLDALECYYPKHTPEQTAYYLSLTEKYRLHVTGGSDFHGEENKPDHPLSALELELDWLL